MSFEVAVSGHIFDDLEIEKQIFSGTEVDLVATDAMTTEQLIDRIDSPDALLNMIPDLDQRVFQTVDQLKVVTQYSIGVDNIDTTAATEADVMVTHVSDYCTDEVSTHTVALILAALRRIPLLDRNVKSGSWSYKAASPLHRLSDQTVGFAAFGQIAQAVRRKFKGFGADVIAYDPYQSEDEIADHDARKVDFETLLSESDIISVHTPLTTETQHLFDSEAFKQMKDSGIVVNCSRGGVIDEVALSNALDQGDIKGAGLDVLAEEPPTDNPLVHREDVIATPHAAWYSEEAAAELRTKAAETVLTALRGEKPSDLVNPEVYA